MNAAGDRVPDALAERLRRLCERGGGRAATLPVPPPSAPRPPRPWSEVERDEEDDVGALEEVSR